MRLNLEPGVVLAAALAALAVAACPARGRLCGDGLCQEGEPAACGDCDEPPICGDGACEAGEACGTCDADCGACVASCGDGSCNGDEDCLSCGMDCNPCGRCGDGLCNTPENCLNCVGDCGFCGGCGDGICDGSENTDCADCTIELGESFPTSLGPTDWSTVELQMAFGIVPSELAAAFTAAEGVAYPFDDWCGPGCATTWIGAYFAASAPVLARGEMDTSDAVDWVMACLSPDGVLTANDDYDPIACASGFCDPGLLLTTPGVWTCVFGAAPFAALNADPYGPITISASPP